MLAVQKSRGSEDKCVPNILPCKVGHTGPSRITKRFWRPTTEQDGSRTSYFRGRKLRGKAVHLPPEYHGVIWKHTDELLPQPPSRKPPNPYDDEDASDEEEDDDDMEQVKVIEQVSTFDNMVVWGHDHLPSDTDTFVKGVEEWIGFAEAIHKPATTESPTK